MTNQFNKGDKVICSYYGQGTVIKVLNKGIFSIHVNFENQDEDDYVEYTTDGRSVLKSPPTLKIKI
jgi:hypothetical protein